MRRATAVDHANSYPILFIMDAGAPANPHREYSVNGKRIGPSGVWYQASPRIV